MDRDLIMYARSQGCPAMTVARRVLDEHTIPFREIYIDQDEAARSRVLAWTGFPAVPTLVLAEPGALLPAQTPDPLPAGASPRGIDRGCMLTEPNADQLIAWLKRHGLITE